MANCLAGCPGIGLVCARPAEALLRGVKQSYFVIKDPVADSTEASTESVFNEIVTSSILNFVCEFVSEKLSQ